MPPDIQVPSSGFEAVFVQGRQHIRKIHTPHESVIGFHDGWSGNHDIFFGLPIPAFHVVLGSDANKRGHQVDGFVVTPPYNYHVVLVDSVIHGPSSLFPQVFFILHAAVGYPVHPDGAKVVYPSLPQVFQQWE